MADVVRGESTGKPVSQLLEDSKITKLHWKIWALSAMGVFLDGFDFFVMAVALPLISAQWSPASWETGLVASSALVGAVFGASVIGRFTDVIGRRRVYTLDLLLFIVFSILAALSWGIWPLIIFRFFLGVAVGADYPISAAYVAEIMPSRSRGRFMVGAFSFQAWGAIFGALAALVILTVYMDVDAWRWMFLLGVIPAIAISWMRRSVPESPRWLADNGRPAEAAGVISTLVEEEITPAQTEEFAREMGERDAASEQGSLEDLLSAKFRRRTILATAPWFLQDIATYGVGIFTPTILAALSIGSHEPDVFLSRAITTADRTLLVDTFLVVGFAFAIYFVDRIGRMAMQLQGFVMMAIGLVVLAASTYFVDASTPQLLLVFTGFFLFNFFMNLGPNSTTYVVPAEVFPTNIRATAHGIAAASAKVGATLGAFLFPILNDDIGTAPTLYIVAGCALLGAVITKAFGVETARRTVAS